MVDTKIIDVKPISKSDLKIIAPLILNFNSEDDKEMERFIKQIIEGDEEMQNLINQIIEEHKKNVMEVLEMLKLFNV